MEDKRLFSFRKVFLRVQVCWLRDDPPAAAHAMDIVRFENAPQNASRPHLLYKSDRVIARLTVHVVANLAFFVFRQISQINSEDTSVALSRAGKSRPQLHKMLKGKTAFYGC